MKQLSVTLTCLIYTGQNNRPLCSTCPDAVSDQTQRVLTIRSQAVVGLAGTAVHLTEVHSVGIP